MAIKRKMNLGFGTDPMSVNLSSLPPQAAGEVGGVYEQAGKGWQMYQLVDAGPAVIGDVGYIKLSSGVPLYGQCTRTIGNSTGNLAVGVFTFAVTLNYYTLIQTMGYIAGVKAETSYDGLGDQGFAHTANNSLAGVNLGVAAINLPVAIGLGAIAAGLTPSLLKFGYI
jgi:hypothetical protein